MKVLASVSLLTASTNMVLSMTLQQAVRELSPRSVPQMPRVTRLGNVQNRAAQEKIVLMCTDINYEDGCDEFDPTPLGTCYGVPDPYKTSMFSADVSSGIVCQFYADDECGGPCTACVDSDGFPNMERVPTLLTAKCTKGNAGICEETPCAFGGAPLNSTTSTSAAPISTS